MAKQNHPFFKSLLIWGCILFVFNNVSNAQISEDQTYPTFNSSSTLSEMYESFDIILNDSAQSHKFYKLEPITDEDSLFKHTIKCYYLYNEKLLDTFIISSQKLLEGSLIQKVPLVISIKYRVLLNDLLAGATSMHGDQIKSYYYIKQVLHLIDNHNDINIDKDFFLAQEALMGAELSGKSDENNYISNLYQRSEKSLNDKIRLMRYYLAINDLDESKLVLDMFNDTEKQTLDYCYFKSTYLYKNNNYELAKKVIIDGLDKNTNRLDHFVYYSSKIYLLLGKINYHQNRTDEALKYFLLAKSGFEKSPNKVYEKELYSLFSQVYSEKGDYTKALKYSSLSIEILNEIAKNNYEGAIVGIDHSFRANQQEIDLVKVEAQFNIQNSMLNRLKIFIAIVLLLGTILLAQNINIKKKNKEINTLNMELLTLNKQLKSHKSLIEKNNEELKTHLETRSKLIDRLKRFSGILAHDLKEPVRMVYTFGELLSKENSNDNNINTQYLSFMLDGARRTKEIIDRLYKYSNDSLLLLSDFEYLDIEEVIHSVKKILQLKIEEKNAIIEIESMPLIYGAEILIYQLFQNLISNSLKYSRENITPEIYISGSIQNDKLKIEVVDNGIGIEEKNKLEIFNLLKRSHNAEDKEGYGIGLATCKEVMEIHNGEIDYISTLDVGTTFILLFPNFKEKINI